MVRKGNPATVIDSRNSDRKVGCKLLTLTREELRAYENRLGEWQSPAAFATAVKELTDKVPNLQFATDSRARFVRDAWVTAKLATALLPDHVRLGVIRPIANFAKMMASWSSLRSRKLIWRTVGAVTNTEKWRKTRLSGDLTRVKIGSLEANALPPS
jgi:hypothetical protein